MVVKSWILLPTLFPIEKILSDSDDLWLFSRDGAASEIVPNDAFNLEGLYI